MRMHRCATAHRHCRAGADFKLVLAHGLTTNRILQDFNLNFYSPRATHTAVDTEPPPHPQQRPQFPGSAPVTVVHDCPGHRLGRHRSPSCSGQYNVTPYYYRENFKRRARIFLGGYAPPPRLTRMAPRPSKASLLCLPRPAATIIHP